MKLSEQEAEAVQEMVRRNEPNALIYAVIFGAANHQVDPVRYYHDFIETRIAIDAHILDKKL